MRSIDFFSCNLKTFSNITPGTLRKKFILKVHLSNGVRTYTRITNLIIQKTIILKTETSGYALHLPLNIP